MRMRMLTRTQILRAESIRNAQMEEIDRTFALRRKSDAAWEAWDTACRTAAATRLPTDYLWSKETRRKIREGDREMIEDAILFLEVDPWFFNSGYLKEHLLDTLKQAPLTEEDKERIRRIIIRVAGGRNRREFRRFCKLAVKVASDEFVETIERMAREKGQGSGGKFAYLLEYLREHWR